MLHRCVVTVLLYIIHALCQSDDKFTTEITTTIINQEVNNTTQGNRDDVNLDPIGIYVEDKDSQELDALEWLNKILSESWNVSNDKFNDQRLSLTGEYEECITSDNQTGHCVSYYQCDPDSRTIIEDGSSIINFRSELAPCPHYLQVCCILDKMNIQIGDTSNKTSNRLIQSDSIKVLNNKAFDEETNKCGWNNKALNIFQPISKEMADNSPYANYGDFPWMIALIRKLSESAVWSKKDYLGGGSLIQPGVVLTVVHKVKDIAAKDLKCRAGEWDTQTTLELFAHQERDVQKIIMHPEYFRPSLYNDIGLLFLETPFDLTQSPNIGIACVGTSLPPPSTECYSMGWGKEFQENNKYAVILKKIRVPLVSAPNCQSLLRNTRLGPFFVLHESLTCAGGQAGVDTCLRDGGSSLVCPIQTLGENTRFAVFGMVAYGIGCGKINSPGVYVNVPHLKSWLDATIASEGYTSDLYTYL